MNAQSACLKCTHAARFRFVYRTGTTDPFVAINGDNRKAFESAYTAMLAAAPKPEGE